MKKQSFRSRDGFAALVSTVIISAILLVAAASAARASFWARFGLFARENKKISAELAESCINIALLDLAEGKNIIFPEQIEVDGLEKCEISSIGAAASGGREIIVKANWKNSHTNIKVIAKLESGEFILNDWREF